MGRVLIDLPLAGASVADNSGNAAKMWLKAAAIAAWVAPIVGLFTIVWRYGVDVPFWDEWTVGTFLAAAHARGYPLLSELFAQHNESRPIIPRLIFLSLASLTHWNLRAQMFFNLTFMVVGAVGLLLLVQPRIPVRWKALLLCAAANLIFFSPIQEDNCIWGFQLVVFAPMVALIWALICLDRPERSRIGVLPAGLLALAATYSFANGMSLWVLLFPAVLWHTRASRRRMVVNAACWLIAAAASIGLYFHGYEKPGGTPSYGYAAHHLAQSWLYFLRFLGNGVRVDPSAGNLLLMGLISGIGALAAFTYVARHCRNAAIVSTHLPWLTLMSYTLISAVTTTAGRVGSGEIVPADRYVTFAVPLYVGLLFMGAVIFYRWQIALRFLPGAYFLLGAAAGVGVIGMSLPWNQGISDLKMISTSRLTGRTALQFYDVAPDPQLINAGLTFVQPPELTDKIHALYREGLLSCGLFQNGDISRINAGRKNFEYGSFDHLQITGATVSVSGWARIGRGNRPADAVLLTAPDGADAARIFCIVEDSHDYRPDIAEKFNVPALTFSGWIKQFDISKLPQHKRISAWAYDSAARKAYLLKNSQDTP